MDQPAFDDLVVRVRRSGDLSPDEERQVAALFQQSYRQGDVEYLRHSMQRLRSIACAVRGGELVGFAIGESRRLDLPRLPAQVVHLAGLACIAPDQRRRGLMTRLTGLAMMTGCPEAPGLACGRMAHPVTLRSMMHLPSAVPRVGVRPSPWQQDVGEVIADAYGVHRFDRATFVCRGRGRPIGFPVVEIEATPEEWELFRPVNRAHGDSLLGFGWLGEVPMGWESER